MSKQYTIMCSRHCRTGQEFEDCVNAMLKDGWVLQGGVSVVKTNGKPVMYQAMYLEVLPVSASPSLPGTPLMTEFIL
jgi:hypothetical protein